MNILIDFLLAHPLIGLILVVLLVCVLVFVLRKLFKIAVLLAVVFLIAGGTVFHISHREVAQKGKELLQSAQTTVTTKVRRFIPGFDSSKTDTVRRTPPADKRRRRTTGRP